MYQLVNGEVSVSKLRDVEVEDLLGREPIRVDLDSILGYVQNKVVMVTGGGGSIGSELCRQLSLIHISTELAALLAQVGPGDEIIMPSFTFVSTADAFVLRGAVPVFVDIRPDTMNIDETLIEAAITEKTKAIVPVHYAGVGCEMDAIMDIARRHKLLVIEDAAQGIMAYYKGKALGAIGDFGCFSFHETKNYSMGEGLSLIHIFI